MLHEKLPLVLIHCNYKIESGVIEIYFRTLTGTQPSLPLRSS